MLQETFMKITELQKLYLENKTNTSRKLEIANELINIFSIIMNNSNLSKSQKRTVMKCNVILATDLACNSNKIRLREVFRNLQEALSNWKREIIATQNTGGDFFFFLFQSFIFFFQS